MAVTEAGSFWKVKPGALVYWDGKVVGEVVDVSDEGDSHTARIKVAVSSAPWLEAYSYLSVYTP